MEIVGCREHLAVLVVGYAPPGKNLRGKLLQLQVVRIVRKCGGDIVGGLVEPAGIQPDIICLSKSLSGYGLPFAVYLLRNYMGGLPREVFESAAIDGASPVTAFFRLALPMSVPAIAQTSTIASSNPF